MQREERLRELAYFAVIAGSVLLAATPWLIVLYLIDVLGRIK